MRSGLKTLRASMQVSSLVIAVMLAGAARAGDVGAGTVSPAPPLPSERAEIAPAAPAAAEAPAPVGDRAEPATAAAPPVEPIAGPAAPPPLETAAAPAADQPDLPPLAVISGDLDLDAPATAPVPAGMAPADVAPVETAAAPALPELPPLAEISGRLDLDPPAPSAAAPDLVAPRVDLAALAVEIERGLATPRGAVARLGEAERTALAAFYRDRARAPLFVDSAGLAAPARAAAARMMRAAYDGLDARAYVLALPQDDTDAATLARAELELVATLMRYARDASQGRVDPRRVSASITVERRPLDPAEVLARLAAGGDVAAAIDAFNPPHPGFAALRRRLAEALDATAATAAPAAEKLRADAPPAIPPGPALRLGARDTRVALLRTRLGLAETGRVTETDADVFDADLAQALKAFQRDNGISPTGTLGPQTLERLNAGLEPAATGSIGEDKALVADLIANMERWRWLPRDLGRQHVFVNVADFSLVVSRDGKIAHKARTIVGKVEPERQTPIFSEMMDHIVVNPYWNVPPNIVRKEMMSKIVSTGGGSVASGAWEVYVGNRQVDPRSVDWASTSPGAVSIRQKPGPSNALGNIKFMFPNNHSVYIHDTSSRGLFARDFRAMSHGCVRVHEPFEFANALLAEEPNVSGEGLRKMVGNGGERYIRLASPIPVHITYFTRFTDADGTLVSRPDIYGHNGRVKAALGL